MPPPHGSPPPGRGRVVSAGAGGRTGAQAYRPTGESTMSQSTRSKSLWRRALPAGAAVLAAAAIWCAADEQSRIPGAEKWTIHDMTRPKPPVVTPGEPSTREKAGTAPSDAVVLFDGKDMSQWATGGGEAK